MKTFLWSVETKDRSFHDFMFLSVVFLWKCELQACEFSKRVLKGSTFRIIYQNVLWRSNSTKGNMHLSVVSSDPSSPGDVDAKNSSFQPDSDIVDHFFLATPLQSDVATPQGPLSQQRSAYDLSKTVSDLKYALQLVCEETNHG